MSLSGWDKMAKTTAVTAIHGHNENETSTDSAIPWIFDDWFHGDFRISWPENRDDAIRKKDPSLEEYDNNKFPAWRIHADLEIGFNTPDGKTIPSGEWDFTTEDSEQAHITLEENSSDNWNPFRGQLDHYDDNSDIPQSIPGKQETEHQSSKKISVEANDGTKVDGIRATFIWGGSDKYLHKAKADDELNPLLEDNDEDIPAAISKYLLNIPPFYTFTDFAFMADGTKLVRMWDSSRYPAHGLYLGGTHRDNNDFVEGVHWNTDTYHGHSAFVEFGVNGNMPGYTPYSEGGSLGYELDWDVKIKTGRQPRGVGKDPGSIMTGNELETKLTQPYFPSSIDNFWDSIL